jgi:hypothetical protein
MPFALLIVGVFLLVAGVRGTQNTLFALVKGDFTGTDNFIYWLLAILIIGAIGYIPKLKPISTGFLVLVIVVLFLSKGGFFAQFTSAIGTTGAASSNASVPNLGTLQQLEQQNQQNLANILQQLQATF